jgi:hypothetical protein
MDYCIPCSRTLNGAVTCPECGAYDSDMAHLSDRGEGASVAVDYAMPEGRFGGEPGPSPDVLEVPAPRVSGAAAMTKSGVLCRR